MRDKTRNRIGAICLLSVASLLGGIAGEGLVLSFTFLKNHGCLPPVSSLWKNAVWVEGLALFLAALPGLMVLLIYSASGQKLSVRRTLGQFSFAVLFMITSALSYMFLRSDSLSIAGGAVVALAVAATVVLTNKAKSQNQAREATS